MKRMLDLETMNSGPAPGVSMPTLLAITAHPDDETLCSGVLAMAAARGWRVALACATRGEAGEIAGDALATVETLGAVREEELRCACAQLGFEELFFLGYCDSGMAGTPLNDRPTSFTRADPETVVRQLVSLMRELRPQSVITFEPFGIYGHPDHIAISRYATEAFDRAADAEAFADSGRPWQPQTLYYGALPLSWIERIGERMVRAGLGTSGIEEMFEQIKGPAEAVAAQITHEVDVSAYVPRKTASLACHRTQLTDHALLTHLKKPMMADIIAREFYIEARNKNGADQRLF